MITNHAIQKFMFTATHSNPVSLQLRILYYKSAEVTLHNYSKELLRVTCYESSAGGGGRAPLLPEPNPGILLWSSTPAVVEDLVVPAGACVTFD